MKDMIYLTNRAHAFGLLCKGFDEVELVALGASCNVCVFSHCVAISRSDL